MYSNNDVKQKSADQIALLNSFIKKGNAGKFIKKRSMQNKKIEKTFPFNIGV